MKKNIKENNKLIADFLGLKYIGKDCNGFSGDVYDCTQYDTENRNIISTLSSPLLYCNTQTMKFHSSWDWLMPVIEKIQIIADSPMKYLKEYPGLIDFNIDLSGASCDFSIGNSRLIGITAFEPGTLLPALYECTVEFIKWYNKNTKK